MTQVGLSAPPPGWNIFFTPEGAQLLAHASVLSEAGKSATQLSVQLRNEGVAADSVAAILTQLDLRQKAASKLGPLTPQMLLTMAGVEQATRWQVAARHADRFRNAGCTLVADLGCGIGAESLALMRAGVDVWPAEIDPFTAQVAEHNLRVFSEERARIETVPERGARSTAQVTVGDVEQLPLPLGIDGVFLDPARRTAGQRNTRRLTSHNDYSPSLDFAFGLGARLPTGVKLGPGFPRELIPDSAEAEWVSHDGSVVEMALWFGEVARSGVSRVAVVMRGTGAHELTAAADAADAEVVGLREYLYEPDGAVIRARLIGQLATDLGAGMLSDGIAYLASDAIRETPFAQAFRVLEELPSREKDLRKALQAREIGSLEIKKRGIDVDPAALRTRLRLRGPHRATLILTRAEGRHVALLAERC